MSRMLVIWVLRFVYSLAVAQVTLGSWRISTTLSHASAPSCVYQLTATFVPSNTFVHYVIISLFLDLDLVRIS